MQQVRFCPKVIFLPPLVIFFLPSPQIFLSMATPIPNTPALTDPKQMEFRTLRLFVIHFSVSPSPLVQGTPPVRNSFFSHQTFPWTGGTFSRCFLILPPTKLGAYSFPQFYFTTPPIWVQKNPHLIITYEIYLKIIFGLRGCIFYGNYVPLAFYCIFFASTQNFPGLFFAKKSQTFDINFDVMTSVLFLFLLCDKIKNEEIFDNKGFFLGGGKIVP
jgi:hypothetical protein